MVFNNQGNRSIKSILSQSSKAICGATEREITVPSDKVSSIKQTLKKNNFLIVGTSDEDFTGQRVKKIWFAKRGGATGFL